MTYKNQLETVSVLEENTINNEADFDTSGKKLSDVQILTMPKGGFDRLNFIAWDTIEVEGFGQDTIELRGYYIIDRADPSSDNWLEASVDIVMAEMNVSGVSQKFGPVKASVNYEIGKESRGQVRAGGYYPDVADSPKLCEMHGFMKFELSAVPMTVFNKEPILLQHKITHIPPIGQGGGTPEGTSYQLFDMANPDGPPVAILRKVQTHIGSWLD